MNDVIAFESIARNEAPMSMAAAATHPAVLELVQKFVPRGSRIADLGAGQGALSVELDSAGYQVVAVDMDRANWKTERIPVRTCDLDSEFAEELLETEGRFDAVVAVEIIEHLENPFRFIRECSKLLVPGGLLFVTTPNVDGVYSRIVFFYTGRLLWFGVDDTVRPAHITPIFRWKLDLMFRESNLELISESFVPYEYNATTNIKVKAANWIAKVIAPLLKGDKGDAGRLMVARSVAQN